METESKVARLCRLKHEIEETIKCNWLFPEQGPVRGFLGTGPIMFVAGRPSTGQFPDPRVQRFYDILADLNLADSHLTDVIKCRGKAEEGYPSDLAIHKRIFDQEIEIIQPRLVVALGDNAYLLLLFSLADRGIPIRKADHYSYRFARPGRKTLKQQVEEAVDLFVGPHDPT